MANIRDNREAFMSAHDIGVINEEFIMKYGSRSWLMLSASFFYCHGSKKGISFLKMYHHVEVPNAY